jgi:hypothetical protein
MLAITFIAVYMMIINRLILVRIYIYIIMYNMHTQTLFRVDVVV